MWSRVLSTSIVVYLIALCHYYVTLATASVIPRRLECITRHEPLNHIRPSSKPPFTSYQKNSRYGHFLHRPRPDLYPWVSMTASTKYARNDTGRPKLHQPVLQYGRRNSFSGTNFVQTIIPTDIHTIRSTNAITPPPPPPPLSVVPADAIDIKSAVPLQHVEPFLNAINAAKQLAHSIEDSVVSSPRKILGGPEELEESVNNMNRGMAVSGSYTALNSLIGIKPSENNENSEYRRVTQVPSIIYNLTKNQTPYLNAVLPHGLLESSILHLKHDIQGVDDVIDTVSSIQQRFQKYGKETEDETNSIVSHSNNRFPKEVNEAENNKMNQLYALKEQAVARSMMNHGKIFFTPASQRLERAHLLQDPFLHIPYMGRTYKTAIPPSNIKQYERIVPKQSFSELIDYDKPLGPLQKLIKDQSRPRRVERLDIL